MSTFAILGATGRNGNTILRVLAESVPDAQINVLVRSSSKLEKMSPELCRSERVHIYQGNITDIDTLQACITNTKAVFLAVAPLGNMPSCRIAQDQVESVVAALSRTRQSDSSSKPPRLVVLSSAETEAKMCASIPWPIRDLLFIASANVYNDLIAAEKYLRKQADWIDSVFVKPGGLSHGEPSGHYLALEQQQTFLSYQDLAAGMVEIALEEGGRWSGKSVGVTSNKRIKIEWEAPWELFRGLLISFFPVLYSWLF